MSHATALAAVRQANRRLIDFCQESSDPRVPSGASFFKIGRNHIWFPAFLRYQVDSGDGWTTDQVIQAVQYPEDHAEAFAAYCRKVEAASA